MKQFIYIKKNIAKHFISFSEALKSEEYNNLGETWEDYLDNKWVLLNDELTAFYKEHPTASVREVFNMEIITSEKTLERVKEGKILEIESYNHSTAVDSFIFNGLTMWLTVEERLLIATLINASEGAGRETMTRWFGGLSYTFPLSTWKQMLIALEIYAGDALNVTESHKAAVETLTTINEIEEYDITVGYPEKLIF